VQLATVTNETLEILMNEEIIAINQDSVVGTSVSPFRWGVNVRYHPLCLLRCSSTLAVSPTGPSMPPILRNIGVEKVRTGLYSCLWVQSEVMCFWIYIILLQINVLNKPADMFFTLTESPWIGAGRQYSIRVRCSISRLSISVLIASQGSLDSHRKRYGYS
jgi:alpha-galactosidase